MATSTPESSTSKRRSTPESSTSKTPSAGPVYSSLVGLAALVVLLQGLWAGIFLKPEGITGPGWIDVHARGADLGILLGVLATGYALWKLRARKDLWVGSLVFTVLMVLEAFVGGKISEGKDTLTVLHYPLAMALLGLAVWLPLRTRRR